MINLNDIKGVKAIDLLSKYDGKNPYILKLKDFLNKNGKISLTENQIEYITSNYNTETTTINRVVKISEYLSDELQKKYNLSFKIDKILIVDIIAESDKTYHANIKLTQKQKEPYLIFLPKTQLLDDPYYQVYDVDIDFKKYDDILEKTGKKLYSHQKEGVKFLVPRDFAILADDMGLGKSMQSIIAALECGANKILVITTAPLKINWKREIETFTNDVVIVENQWTWRTSKFTIINYDILKHFHTLSSDIDETDKTQYVAREIANAGFDLIIADEAHNLKNKDSIRGSIIQDLSNYFKIKKIWLLTGTPVANRPMDFYNLLKILRAKITENWKFYVERYCDAKRFKKKQKNGKLKTIWVTTGASNLDELAHKTKNLLLRRLKNEVLDMPKKVVVPVYYDLTESERKKYQELWDEYIEERKRQKKRGSVSRALVELTLLRKYIANTMIKKTIELVDDALEQDKKIIIFTTYKEELQTLVEHYGDICVYHSGELTLNEKQESVDQFQTNPKIKIFIGNIKSAGVGITLTKGTVVIFNSFDWVTGNNEQAEDRAYRIGQNEDVTVFYQLFEDSISIRMWDTLKNKKEIISVILGDKNATEEYETDKIMEYLIDLND